jgi:hypothetical protein
LVRATHNAHRHVLPQLLHERQHVIGRTLRVLARARRSA